MRLGSIETALVLWMSLWVFVGCGTLVGNPKRPQDGSSATTPQVVSLPTINFALPASLVTLGSEEESETDGLGLIAARNPKFTLLHAFSDRSNRIVQGVNEVIDFLRQESVTTTGSFSGKGSQQRISGHVVESSDPIFPYEAVVCFDDEPFLRLMFDESGERLRATKEFSKGALGEKLKSEFISEIDFEKSSTGTTSIVVRTQGKFPQAKSQRLRYDGPYLFETMRYTRSRSGAFSISGVNDWSDDALPASFEGDGYIVGQVAEDGTGESIGYRKASLLLCRGGFDEDAADLFTALPVRGEAGWCFGQAIGSATPYSSSEKIQAMKRLESVGVTKKSELQQLKGLSEATCDP
jgi:hypothetical protein